MITKEKIDQALEEILSRKNLFLVELKITSYGKISVFLDGKDGVTINDCSEITRFLQEFFGEEIQQYDLEVSSAGIDLPLRHKKQYEISIGKQIEVITNDGQKYLGELTRVESDSIILKTTEQKQEISKEITINNHNIKNTKRVISV